MESYCYENKIEIEETKLDERNNIKKTIDIEDKAITDAVAKIDCGNKIAEKVEIDEKKTIDKDVKIEVAGKQQLIYKVSEAPPIHITIICGLQQALLSLAPQLVVSLLVADAVCARDNDAFKVRLLSSTNFMNGVTTLAMVTLGTRLPLFQGAAAGYVLPLLIIASADSGFCSNKAYESGKAGSILCSNTTTNQTECLGDEMEVILRNVRALSGSLMVCGVIHAMLGFSGIIGLILRFVGPLTIVSCMILASVFLAKVILPLAQVHWGIALSTAGIAIILSLYLQKHNAPVPVWTPKVGFRIIWYPLHQVFSILIAILVNWLLCGILTGAGALTNDPEHPAYKTRTDARSAVIADSPWFNVPYPGQYGMVSFSIAAFFACFIATMMSVLDSIGDYYACARVSRVPPPPAHAVNRGILIEGTCSFLSGAVGCGHATSTYGGNIGAIGITKVASRHTFVCCAIIFILFGILGKLSALFITIPYPVLGGASIAMFSSFTGVAISNLQVVSLSSSRNMATLGVAVILGLMIPTYVNNNDQPFNSGNETFDRVLTMILGNPTLAGTVIAFFLDNTVPGTKEERGIAAWVVPKEEKEANLDRDLYDEGYEVYQPLMPRRFLKFSFIKHIPFLPHLD